MTEQRIRICPSMLAANLSQLDRELARISHADMLHVDIMDGVFVPNISFGPMVAQAARENTHLNLDVHLMVNNPDAVVEMFAPLQPEYLTIHYEASVHLHRSLGIIRDHGIKAGVSLNPHTPVHLLQPILSSIDMILIMSVNPGFGGQTFIPETLEKLRQAREMVATTDIRIEVDGGISLANVGQVVEAGADTVVAGSTIFNAEDPNDCIRRLREEGSAAIARRKSVQ